MHSALAVRAWAARRICRLLPPSLSYRLHFALFESLVGTNAPFSERGLFGPAGIKGTMEANEDAYFALHGTANYPGMVAAQHFVRAGDTVFELGANRGTETVSLANLAGAEGRVVALEPDPQTATILEARTAELPQVTVVREAAAEAGSRTSWFHSASDGSSFLGVGVNDGLSSVLTTTGDALVTRFGVPAFVFIDIEGSEMRFLRGATHLLNVVRPPMYCEVIGSHLKRAGNSVAELATMLREHDYRAFDAQRRDLSSVDLRATREETSTDWLLLPNERSAEARSLRGKLQRARFMPRLPGLNPLDASWR